MRNYGGSVEGFWEGKAEILRTNCPTANLCTRNPALIELGLKPKIRGEQPKTNRLRNGIALFIVFSLRHSKQISL